ncbi:D-alanyl-D-alanine carboxypeptidase family protein [Pseudoflavonifractor sp. HCP28S3_F10]|uniref:D-alanyl-D-alanine carboxypeptidase family protein n=1 Tax=Pseudoflavonifractor sp. HCP28S3_F10 TaxID=3438947 RepID=UPI003F8BAD15
MKRVWGTLLSLLLLTGTAPALAAGPAISAQSAILVDADSGRVLYAHNAGEERPIASTTKLMTALVAVESTPELDAVFTIRREWTGIEGSSMYLKAGEQLTLRELLCGLMLSSGNDAAVAIAGGCAGDVETFVGWMNRRAADLGMEHTHFSNPNGLQDEDNYSTARDMAALARAVLEHEELVEIMSTKSITVAGRTLVNHNKLLWRYEGCIGMKTGYTEKAGRTLVSCAQRDGQRLIAVTLFDRDDWNDHAALLDYGFETYPSTLLARAGKEFRMLPLEGSLNRFIPVEVYSDVRYPLTAQERVKVEVILPERAEAPVERGAIAGQLRFSVDGETVGETYLVYSRSAADDRARGGGLLSRLLGGGEAACASAMWALLLPQERI